MADVMIELRLPEHLGDCDQVDRSAIEIDSIDDFDAPTGGVVSVRRTRQGPVVMIEGTTSNPHALSRHPRVVAVWDAAGRPLWDRPAPEDDASRYAF